jgi:hypothetical protein
MYRKPLGKIPQLSLLAVLVSGLSIYPAYAKESDAERISKLEKKLEKIQKSDAARIHELEKKLEKSLELSKALADRVNQIDGGKTGATETPVAKKVAEQETRLADLEKNVAQTAENASNQSSLSVMGVPIHGFATLGYAAISKHPAPAANATGEKTGFNLSNVDFYLSPNYGDHFKSLVELNFEYSETGQLNTDLERVEAGYTFNDALTVWAGRFHTPYGIWNTAYHHGQYIQTSTERPRFVAFEDQGGILPAHTVGIQASGTIPAGPGKVQYDAFIGNGSRTLLDKGATTGTLDFNPVGNDKGGSAVGGSVRYAFNNGLTVGAHAASEKVNVYNDTNDLQNSTKMRFYGGYYFFEKEGWESIGEYYKFNNKDESGTTGGHSSWAGFAQLGYTIKDTWTPYARYEKASLDQTDNYFSSLASGRSYDRDVVGLRYDFNKSAALKFEFNRTNEHETDGSIQNEKEFRIQYALKF